MRIALTGGTGFIGRYIIDHLTSQGHELRCWYRPGADRTGLERYTEAEWVRGELNDDSSTRELVDGCEAVVHSALYHPGGGFHGGEGELITFVEKNVVGTLRLVEAARSACVRRFIFISTCSVHEKILDDRPLDETHPLWPTSHYGAHKGAIEKFIHSYGLGMGYEICSLRPTGVYGLAHPFHHSKWFELVQAIVRGEDVTCRLGGKEVHAVDVARSVALLLDAANIAGECFNCYDMYISEYDVATIAKELTGSASKIHGGQTSPKHQIVTEKIHRLGMQFGGKELLRQTVRQLVEAAR